MSEPEMRLALAPVDETRYVVPVETPEYRYMICDLLTDQLQLSPALSGVTFDRRVSRPGEFKAQWRISDRATALAADGVTRQGGKLAIWAFRNRRLWWGGILWNASGGISTRSYDTVDIQAATFDSYLDRNYIDASWSVDVGKDMTQKVLDIWVGMQGVHPSRNIDVLTNAGIHNLTGDYLDQQFEVSDMVTYGNMVRAYTDAEPGCDHTIDVYQDGTGARIKRARTAGSFQLVEQDSRLVISGYRVPSWKFTRDSTKSGTRFRAWGDAQSGNVGTDQKPMSSEVYLADDLIAQGWPILDVADNIGALPTSGPGGALNRYARTMRDQYSGIRDVVQYDVDLATSEWHPNLIGQNVVIKHSKNDLWRPGETAVIRPVVASFTAPERGQPERVSFTIDGAEVA